MPGKTVTIAILFINSYNSRLLPLSRQVFGITLELEFIELRL